MKNKINCVLLIDDNEDDNLYHEIVIQRTGIADLVRTATTAAEALEYFTISEKRPELIFLDINMPKVNGFEFLDMYKELNGLQHSRTVIVMLTTSLNPSDKMLAESNSMVTEFRTKPLTKNMLTEILHRHFSILP